MGPVTTLIVKSQEEGFAKTTQVVENLTKTVEKLVQTFGNSPRGIMKAVEAIKDLQNAAEKQSATLEKLASGFEKSNQAASKFGNGILSMKGTMSSFLSDMEKMIAIQARWYGARILIDPIIKAVETLASLPKVGAERLIEVDTYRAMIERYGNMENQAASITKAASAEIIQQARIMSVQLPIAFDEIMKSADRLMAAGLSLETVKKSMESFAKLHISFPEINMEKFSTALVGFLNTYRNAPGMAEMADDAERLKSIMDKLVVVLAKSVLAPADITSVIQYMGQIGSAAGFSIDQLGALAGMVTNLGSKAGPAARSLRGLMLSMSSDRGVKQLEKMGIIIDKNITLADQFVPVLKKINDLVGSGAMTVGSLNALTGIASTERLSPLLALIKELPKYEELVKASADSTGALDRVAVGMGDTIGGLLLRIQNLWKEMGTLVIQSDTLKEALEGVFIFMKVIAGAIFLVANQFGVLYLGISAVINLLYVLTDVLTTASHMFANLYTLDFKANNKLWDDLKARVSGTIDYLSKKTDAWVQGGAAAIEIILGPSGSPTTMLKGKGAPARKNDKSLNIEKPDTATTGGSLLSSTDKYYKALEKMELAYYNRGQKLSKDAYTEGKISLDEYYSYGLYRVENWKNDSLDALKEWDEESKKAFEKQRKDASGKKGSVERLEAVKQAEIAHQEDLIARKAAITTKYEEDKSTLEKTRLADSFVSQKRSAEQEANLQKQKNEQIEEIEKASIERKKAVLADLYSNNEITMTYYYAQEKKLLEASAAMNRKKVNDDIDSQLAAINTELLALTLAKQTEGKVYEDLANKEILLTEKRNTDLLKINEDLGTKLYEQSLKINRDINLAMEENDLGGAIYKSLKQVVNDFPKAGTQLLTLVKELSQAMSTTIGDFFFDSITGKLKSLEDYINSFLTSVARAVSNLMAQQMTQGVMAQAMSWIGPGVIHEGGIVGEVSSTRVVPSSTFVGAPRFHTGIGPGERAAIIENTEGVFTKGQMAALGKGMSSGSDSSDRPIVVEIINQTKEPVKSSSAQVKFELDKIVISTILLDVQQNGPISRSLKR